MPKGTNQRLWNDPLWCALADAITKLRTGGTDTLRRWTQNSASIEQIHKLAKKAGLTNLPVIKIEFEKALLGPDGWKHDDRWQIQFNHPVPTRNPITVYLGRFPPVRAKAALREIVKYLGDWQSARAEQLNVIEQPRQPSGGPAAASDVEVKTITVTVALQRYVVSRSTLRRAVRNGELRDFRRPESATNSPLLLDEKQIACRWPTKG